MNEDAPTRVTWELEPMAGNVTKVTVVHENFQGETTTYKGLKDGGSAWILAWDGETIPRSNGWRANNLRRSSAFGRETGRFRPCFCQKRTL